jgi:hypothetical protein
MRWLVVHPGPHFSVQDVYTGWCEGLRANGETVIEFNLGDRLNAFGFAFIEDGDGPDGSKRFRKMYSDKQVIDLAMEGLSAVIFQQRPDVLLIVSGFFFTGELIEYIRMRGIAVVILHTESPYEDDRQLEIAQYATLNLLNDPVNIEAYEALGVPVGYMPHAYRPAVHHPGPSVPDLVSDFAFVGTGYASRRAFFEAMNLDGLNVLLAGNWQCLEDTDSPLLKHVANGLDTCLDNAKAVDIYRSAAVNINTYRKEASHPSLVQGIAVGPREVELAACGAFFLRESRPEGDDLFPMLPVFFTPEEASDLLRWYLPREDKRQAAAQSARRAIEGRTFTNHAAALLRRIVP